MRHIVRQMLRSLGVQQVIETSDGSAALQLLREHPVDVIISDWNMVPMTGYQLLLAVREDPATRHLPFIMITGERSLEYVTLAHSAGVSGYLIKPFGLDRLERQMRRALDRGANGKPQPELDGGRCVSSLVSAL